MISLGLQPPLLLGRCETRGEKESEMATASSTMNQKKTVSQHRQPPFRTGTDNEVFASICILFKKNEFLKINIKIQGMFA